MIGRRLFQLHLIKYLMHFLCHFFCATTNVCGVTMRTLHSHSFDKQISLSVKEEEAFF